MKPLLTPYLKDRRNSIAALHVRGDILDLGCGSADILRYLDTRGHYVGIDSNPDLIEGLRSSRDIPDSEFYLQDLDEQGLDMQGTFDTVLMIAVIEHLQTPEELLAAARKVMNSSGSLIITTPTPLADKLHGLLAKIGLTHKDAVQQHHRLYSKRDMLALLSSCGLSLQLYKRFELGLNQLFVCRT